MSELSQLQESILNTFCAGQQEKRDFLRTPFQIGDYACATNVFATVFIKGNCGNILNREGIEKLMQNKLDSIPNQLIPFPDISIPDKKLESCEECKGKGEVEFQNNFNAYDFTCKTCDGHAVHEVVQLVTFDETSLKFDAKHLRKIAKLPDVQIAFDSEKLCFQFEHGKGFLMSTTD